MQKIKMSRGTLLTFEEVCNKYLENCRQRNLREGTIGHYRQSYTQFFEYFDPNMPIEDIDEQLYKDYVLHLKATLDNDVIILVLFQIVPLDVVLCQELWREGNGWRRSLSRLLQRVLLSELKLFSSFKKRIDMKRN